MNIDLESCFVGFLIGFAIYLLLNRVFMVEGVSNEIQDTNGCQAACNENENLKGQNLTCEWTDPCDMVGCNIGGVGQNCRACSDTDTRFKPCSSPGQSPGQSQSPSQSQSPIPQDCVRYYDGCNRCVIKDGSVVMCSEMMCYKHMTPFCQLFADGTRCADAQCTMRHSQCANCQARQRSGEIIACHDLCVPASVE